MLSAERYLQENEPILQTDTGDVVLNEIYFGPIPQLLVMEELFDKLKLSYKKINIDKNPKQYRQLINDPILKKIGKQVCEGFGFKDVYITISKDEYINAYTIGIPVDDKGNSYDENEVPFNYERLVGTIKITNSGFKIETKKFGLNMLICLTLGILFKPVITTKELMAVLLHEIGHTFSKVIYNKKLLSGRVDEKFADNFCAMYGYAEYLVSAFTKMSIDYGDIEKVIKKVPLIGSIVGINRSLNSLLFRTLVDDPHPTLHKRMEDEIHHLEVELKDAENMSPQMKKDIEGQIKRARKILDDYYSNNDDLTDVIVKGSGKYLEPNHPFELYRDSEADKVSSPENINKRIGKVYHKKGFFR